MSDRDAIITSLAQAVSRIRTNRVISRIALGLSILIGVAAVVQIVNLLFPAGPQARKAFWIVWTLALVGWIWKSFRSGPSLSEAAADIDNEADLKDEVVSAYWFLSQSVSNPWVDLQIHRAADRIKSLDLGNLYPRLVPKTSYLAAAGLVLVLVLNWVPFAPGEAELMVRTRDLDALENTEELFNEIEELLDEAERLQPSQAIEEFQELLEQMQDAAMPLDETEETMQTIESMIDEGNLDVANLLEGLEEMGEDLSQSDDSRDAGQKLMEGDARSAAEEFEQLADRLAGEDIPGEDLNSALLDAAENRRPGLEDLASQMEAAAAGLQDQNMNAVEEALRASAATLGELANAIESQRLQNEAAERMDALEEALRQQAEPASLLPQNESTASGEPLETTSGQEAGLQPSEGEQTQGEDIAGPELAAGGDGEAGEMGDVGQQAGQTIENVSGDEGGMIPMGYGFSPAVKEGAPTSLEVQLQEEAIEIQMEEVAPDDDSDTEDLETRRESSSLDYRNVPSDLTPAQQDLLNQDTIPREYQNVIREYFEVIHPDDP